MQINKQNYKIEKHTLRPIVDKIGEVVEFNKRYSYPYWCRLVKNSKLSYNQILDLVDKAKELDDKYNRGGFIRNRI